MSEQVQVALQDAMEQALRSMPESPGILLTVRGIESAEPLELARPRPGTQAFQPRAVFRTASVTKTATALSILRLADQGHLRLDDPVGPALPDAVANLLPLLQPKTEELTFRALMQHTGGLYDYWHDERWMELNRANRARVVDPFEFVSWPAAHGGPLAAPGELWHYCDTGYALLAFALEHTTKLPLEEVYRRELPMHDLKHTWLEGREAALAPPSERAPMLTFGEDPWPWHPSYDTFGGGGFVSNAPDLAELMRAVGRGQVVSPAALADMTAAVPVAPDVVYGLGLFGLQDGDGEVQAWGHFGYHGAFAFWLPSSGVAFGGSTLATDLEQTPDRPSARFVRDIVSRLREVHPRG